MHAAINCILTNLKWKIPDVARCWNHGLLDSYDYPDWRQPPPIHTQPHVCAIFESLSSEIVPASITSFVQIHIL